jgi:phosphate ABC transporter phosphate-binding protein
MPDPNASDDVLRTAQSDGSDKPKSGPPTARNSSSDTIGRLGRYEIRSILGEGAFGRVYLASDPQLKRLVAIKVPKPDGFTADLRERFVREARAVATVHHPNVCPVYDVGDEGDLPFIVMHYLAGTTLAAFLEGGKALPPLHAIALTQKLAQGVAAAHAQGITHRDLKPQNVLFDPARQLVLITDFGLARIDNQTHLTAAGAVFGTPLYMSPEQARGKQDEVGPHSDIYSLGVILYRMLTGEVPFRGDEGVFEVLRRHCEEMPAPPSTVRKGLDPRLDQLCLKALAKKPADRYPSARMFADALGEFARTGGSSGWPDVPTTGPRSNSGPVPSQPTVPLVPPAAGNLVLDPRKQAAAAAPPAVKPPPVPPIHRTPAVPPAAPRPSTPGGQIPAVPPAPPAPSAPPAPPTPPAGVPRTAAPKSTAPKPASAPVSQRPAPKPLSLDDDQDLPDESGTGRQKLYVIGGLAAVAALVLVLVLVLKPSKSQPTTPTAPETAGSGGGSPNGTNAGGSGTTTPGGSGVTTPPVTPPVTPPIPVPAGVVLTGEGSSFVDPMMQRWAKLYFEKTGVGLKYAKSGSSAGVREFISRRVLIGGTDAPLTDPQILEADAAPGGGPVVHVPLVMGAVVATYNLPAVKEPLKFPGKVLADIYLGKITKWNDAAIVSNNPGVNLPNLPITVVRRSDGSGTTFIWTDYLTKVSGEWKNGPGVGNAVKWPVGVGADKNDGVAREVSRTLGAIGYVELTFALKQGLPAALIENREGEFVAPSLESVTAAAKNQLKDIPPDLRFTLTDVSGRESYPICGTTWAVVYKKQSGEAGKELVKFLHWAVHDGQAHVTELKYAPLPAELVGKIDKAIETITVAP